MRSIRPKENYRVSDYFVGCSARALSLIVPPYPLSVGTTHSTIGLFRVPKWAKHGQCCGGATPPGTVSGCVCSTWARGDTRHRRLWQQQGKREAAYELLAQVYHWFTEGFDTADLQEAKALEELQGSNTSARAPQQAGVGLIPEVVSRLSPQLAAYIYSETLYFANHVVSNNRRAWL
jgi:hypothetical protein